MRHDAADGLLRMEAKHRKKGALSLLVFLTASCQPSAPSTAVLEFRDGWEFRLAGEPMGADLPEALTESLRTWMPATVPGTVHTDLLANGLIPDPFWRDEEMTLQWIGKKDWTYRTTFDVDGNTFGSEEVDLVFYGLDTFAEVVLNGQAVLTTDNMFRIWTIGAKEHLVPGENRLEIRFRSPLPPALEARASLPYTLPAGNDRGDPPSRVFVRKAAYHYGWDWGPRLVTSGIWRPIQLLAWSGAHIRDVHLATDSLTDEGAFLTAQVELDVSVAEAQRREAGGDVPVSIHLTSPAGAFDPVTLDAVVTPGTNVLEALLKVTEPLLWWPNGTGDPHLYAVQVDLNAGHVTDRIESRFGIRTVELVTEPDSIGESFFFRVNGVPVFMKGANVIPLDHFSPRVTEEQYRSLFRDVTEANMNMLRVWGGGIYEGDLFYDLADEHGILLWQDFMFANGMYPGDSTFLASVRAEATDQIRRLRRHPSLALWCGNNEIDEGWKNWGWARLYRQSADSAAVRDAYEAIFNDILPGAVSEHDPRRPYWPSSPSRGWGDPESLNRGDSHYWGVWHGREPFEVFAAKLPRFSSEFGFQSLPAMETVEAFTESADLGLYHPVFLNHQKHPIGNELIAHYMETEFPVPGGFEEFAYVSQLLQARGMRTAFEAHRRARPRTMGTLYWQLNDTWPVVSWSSRDYFGRWKALHYAAKEAFAPLLLSAVLKADTVEIWGASDLLEPREGSLSVEVMGFDGVVSFETSLPLTLDANRSRRIWAAELGELLQGADPGRTVLFAFFDPGSGHTSSLGGVHGDAGWVGDPLPSTLLYFRPPVELELKAPAIRFDVAEAEGGVLLTLESDVLAKGVYMTLEGEGEDQREGPGRPGILPHFARNFFDLLPNRPRVIFLETGLRPDLVADLLSIRTLAEIPREGHPVPDLPAG